MNRTYKELLEHWGLKSLKINLKFLEATFEPTIEDKSAAWEMYVELLTRVSTQYLLPGVGDEKTALDSIFSLFNTTRDILKRKGQNCMNFTKLAVIILNQVVRPFTSKWHKISIVNGFNENNSKEFRNELQELQILLRCYTQLLSELAGVEDLTSLELDD